MASWTEMMATVTLVVLALGAVLSVGAALWLAGQTVANGEGLFAAFKKGLWSLFKNFP